MSYYRLTPDRNQGAGFRAFSFLGIPVYIEFGFVLFIAIIFLIYSGEGGLNAATIGLWCVAMFFSLLVHEFGHALTAKAVGCDGIRVALRMFGGYATFSPTSRGRSLLITIAGPSAGLILGALCWLLLARGGRLLEIGAEGAMISFLGAMVFINIFWSIFNMIPIIPMDGGWTLFYSLSYLTAPDRAMAWAARVSLAMCVAVGAFAFAKGFPFVALFCFFFFMDNMRILQSSG